MKNRIRLYSLIGMSAIVLGLIWFLRPTKGQEIKRVFNGTVNRDCAPWDGGAFTVSIAYDPRSVIVISVWRLPDINHPISFSFPDQKGNIGTAFYKPLSGDAIELSGSIYFQDVEEDNPLTGDFNLSSVNGDRFEGHFNVRWSSVIVMCG